MVDFSIDREYGGRLRTDGHVEDIEVLSTGYVNYDADFTFESFGEQVPNSDNLAEHAGANMRSGSTLPGLAFALPLAAACGEAVSDKPTGSVSFTTPAEFYPAPESAKPYPAGFPERIGVSGAVVAMGDRTYDANAKEFLPAACDPDFDYRVSFPTGPVIVSPFRLMRTEVTYAMYARVRARRRLHRSRRRAGCHSRGPVGCALACGAPGGRELRRRARVLPYVRRRVADRRLAGQARTQHSAMSLFKDARFPQPGEAIGIATVISPPDDGLTRPYHGFRCVFPAEGP